ncbi:hypothetical protein F4561_001853 [Lipingzhangella halophila]|uniref:DUF2784 domain-containing protein n=1 Tax=Lipingzhangella halophila TaxID=1783352 RepID=A0A7W7W250_9ACTN|nr:DUF2784 domain-containing protein [Lipingzhangella halophila]MBB4931033.1 hypothetical protein [Lipingzhangella halophila]
MEYRIIGEAAMLVHFAFVLYVAFGGFFAWRWPRMFWPHLVIAAYGLGITLVGWTCPLTYIENWGREGAGQAGLEQGFIDTYLVGVIYPQSYLVPIQFTAGVVVAVSWGGLLLLLWRRSVLAAQVERGDPDEPEAEPRS